VRETRHPLALFYLFDTSRIIVSQGDDIYHDWYGVKDGAHTNTYGFIREAFRRDVAVRLGDHRRNIPLSMKFWKFTDAGRFKPAAAHLEQLYDANKLTSVAAEEAAARLAAMMEDESDDGTSTYGEEEDESDDGTSPYGEEEDESEDEAENCDDAGIWEALARAETERLGNDFWAAAAAAAAAADHASA
jgi:hypothetical protein